ncbi:MAG: class I SAM-dependent methyltransferase [Microscillaceae bacterium]|nr:class I SAM-dependent methyltransferase [Microscillaceae bacterium]MDW8459846.1 class I SAM-dependent methyltransferase [Cytophagales bacterium]
MLETLTHCPICQYTHFQHFLTCKDYTVSGEKFDIVQCQQCQFLFTNPRPNEQAISKYYQAENYISHTDTRKGLINRIYHLVRKWTLRQKLHFINQLQPQKGNLLDVGCGTGYFLNACQKDGWHTTGTEPDHHARALAQKQAPQAILYKNIFDLSAKPIFDCITLWHVLEHIHQLDQTLQHFYQILKNSGSLVIAVPNAQSPDARWFQEFWAAYDVPRHLYHFKPKDLHTLFAKYQFRLVKQKTMPFDAYYIALLSNRYKYNQSRYFQSFWQGWYSNQQAKRTAGGNSSSMIYVFQK